MLCLGLFGCERRPEYIDKLEILARDYFRKTVLHTIQGSDVEAYREISCNETLGKHSIERLSKDMALINRELGKKDYMSRYSMGFDTFETTVEDEQAIITNIFMSIPVGESTKLLFFSVANINERTCLLGWEINEKNAQQSNPAPTNRKKRGLWWTRYTLFRSPLVAALAIQESTWKKV